MQINRQIMGDEIPGCFDFQVLVILSISVSLTAEYYTK